MDLGAAMALVNQVPSGGTAMSPVANFDSVTGDVTLSFGWSSVFASKALWGTNTLSSTKALWGTNSIWSSSVLSADKALWGTKAIWGTAGDAATKALWGTDSLSSTSTATSAESTTVNINGEQ